MPCSRCKTGPRYFDRLYIMSVLTFSINNLYRQMLTQVVKHSLTLVVDSVAFGSQPMFGNRQNSRNYKFTMLQRYRGLFSHSASRAGTCKIGISTKRGKIGIRLEWTCKPSTLVTYNIVLNFADGDSCCRYQGRLQHGNIGERTQCND